MSPEIYLSLYISNTFLTHSKMTLSLCYLASVPHAILSSESALDFIFESFPHLFFLVLFLFVLCFLKIQKFEENTSVFKFQ